jgi:hypothetical protein
LSEIRNQAIRNLVKGTFGPTWEGARPKLYGMWRCYGVLGEAEGKYRRERYKCTIIWEDFYFKLMFFILVIPPRLS